MNSRVHPKLAVRYRVRLRHSRRREWRKRTRYRTATPNEYGDFLSDMAFGLIGSIGLGDSASYSFEKGGHVRLAMFDPAGGTAPDIAGQGVCNPSAALLAFGSLLRHIGEGKAGNGLRQAVRDCIAAGEKTGDIGGKMKTAEFTNAVIARLQAAL